LSLLRVGSNLTKIIFMRNNYAKFIAFALLFVPFVAQAAFTGLSGDVYAVNAISGNITYRVYAEFSSPTDQLIAIYGYDTAPMSVLTTTSFFQEPNSGNHISSGINAALFPLIPDLAYDSWLTIGRESATANNLQSIGFNWLPFEAGGNLVVNDLFGGTLFCLPGEVQNFPVGGRVLIAQLTTDGVIDLNLNIQWRDGNNISTDTENILLTLPAAGEGCTDPTAVNYDPAATIDNGTCIFVNPSFTELTWELVASNAIPGFQTYRVYANFTNPNDQLVAIYGQDVTPLSITTSGTFYQNPLGTAYSTGITSGVLGLDPNAAYDSWVTVGSENATGNNLQVLNVNAASFEAGNALTINDPVGGAWFVFPDDQPSAFPDANGRVLVAQLTTDGIVDLTINFQYRAQNGSNPQEVGLNLVFPNVIPGCIDPAACNFNPAATQDDGSCIQPTVWFLDADGDGFGSTTSQLACTQPVGYVTNSNDCDDNNPNAFPGAAEIPCNGIDDSCNGQIDENNVDGCTDPTACNFNAAANCDNGSCTYPTVWFLDADGDGFGSTTSQLACTQPVGYVTNSSDCDDSNANVNPAAAEVPCNTIDDNCNGQIDENDVDGCTDPTACNFNAAANCENGSCTFPTIWFLDADGDGFGSTTSQLACTQPVGYVANSNDCDDSNANVNPAAAEVPCNTIDDNCDAIVDDNNVNGCTDPLACNFDPTANCDDASCFFSDNCDNCAPSACADIFESFDDGNFTAGPTWSGTTGSWNVNSDSDAGPGATCSLTARLAVPTATAGTAQLVTGYSNWQANQEWSYWLGRRGQAYTGANTVAFWLYADQSNLASATINGYRVFIGDNVGGDEFILQRVVNGVATNLISSADLPNGVTDVGVAIRVTRSATGVWTLYTSNLAIAAGGGVAADACPASVATIAYGPANDNTFVPAGSAFVGVNVVYSSSASARSAVEFDQLSIITNAAVVLGCTDPMACNYDALATADDGSCEFAVPGFPCGVIPGCTYAAATNFNAAATIDDGSCLFNCSFLGCTDPTAINYNPSANEDDGSCIAAVAGCTDATAVNYNPSANTDDGSCIATVFGCTDPAAFNYNPLANTDNGGCIAVLLGCTDPAFSSYNPYANTDNGQCFNTCVGDLNTDGIVNTTDLLTFLAAFGTICQ